MVRTDISIRVHKTFSHSHTHTTLAKKKIARGKYSHLGIELNDDDGEINAKCFLSLACFLSLHNYDDARNAFESKMIEEKESE
jgi:hypothetical protein